MFLTPAETVIIGALLGGGISHITTRVAQKATNTRELWQKQCAVYEDTLVQVREMQLLRNDKMRTLITTADPIDLRLEGDPASLRRIEVRLQMFGSRKVREAHAAVVEADRHWIRMYVAKRHFQEEAAKDSRGELPPGTGPTGEQLVEQRRRAEQAQQNADAKPTILLKLWRTR
ncbi:MAG: hypothetical protein ACREP9_20490 [Candidatus Dormibacteraceae bacterium]